MIGTPPDPRRLHGTAEGHAAAASSMRIDPTKFFSIGRCWVNLFSSMCLMTIEAPFLHGIIARGSSSANALAAFGIVMSIALLIESPIIPILATSTALVRTRAAFAVVGRMTFQMALGLSAITAVLAYSDTAFDFVVRVVMGVPEQIGNLAQPLLKAMVFWAAVVAWRRFNQGILIRFGRDRFVAYGTALRVLSTVVIAGAMLVIGNVSALWVGITALLGGVSCEAVFAYLIARYTAIPEMRRMARPVRVRLDYASSLRFHAPLAATSIITHLTLPVVLFALSRSADPYQSLAAWPVAFGILLVFRSPALAATEMVIVKSEHEGLFRTVRAFCLALGVATSALLFLVAQTSLLATFAVDVIGVQRDLAELIVSAVRTGAVLPVLWGVQSWLRGVAMIRRETRYVYYGTLANIATTAAVLACYVGFVDGALFPTVDAAVIALMLGVIAEIVVVARGTGVMTADT